MNKRMSLIALPLALLLPLQPQAAEGPLRIAVERFVQLPADVRQPEGITADPATGEIYVGSFDARMPESSRNNQLLRYSPDGKLLGRRRFGTTPLTGLAYRDGQVYILNFGASRLQRIAAGFGSDTPVEDVASFGALLPPAPGERRIDNPDGSQDRIQFGAAGFPAINGMVFDRAGNLYVSDSFQGAIYRIERATSCMPCRVQTVLHDPLLATAGPLPFGANGLAFDASERLLYINNAGDGRVLRWPLAGGALEVLAESIHGADGLLFHDGLLWVSANQADRVLGLDENGRIRVQAGEFQGHDGDGAPRGLLFPAGSAVSGAWMVVANLSLALTAREGDEWEEETRRWTLSRFRLPRAH
ncbi:hypothetical protein C3942_18480 [Solimonas fluminis]|uniref:SMP-30/Gluconolactonase/LRE-like region domain-containing protein n=1 Tax=Solimonas fluminis TaxID=2086571 RepID=A0A2S5TC42_9GAMM|nr:hypothetical protein [Solimonas fluminis]PPE72526.1 hypothetical protein C3942_18480 [Solimonas fluminis]